MSFWRRHRWNRRILLGLAFGLLAVPAQARPLESASIQGESVKSGSASVAFPDVVERAVTAAEQRQPIVISYLSHGLTAADALDPRTGIPLSAGIPAPGDPFVAEVPKTTYSIAPGRSWYLVADPAPVRPDDRGDRFVVGNDAPTSVAGGDGFTVDWGNGLVFGAGGLALLLALGLGLAYMRRPRIAL